MLRLSSVLAPRRSAVALALGRSIGSSMSTARIIYTETDEAPNLATYALLPVISRMTKPAGIKVEVSDISLSGRVLAQFPHLLTAEQRIPDNLAMLGELCKTPEANIIKLPNISASVPQLISCIAELRANGFNIPEYVYNPKTEEDKINKELYSKTLGSSVNPVLREGNSDRRVAGPVKLYAQKNPHKMGAWSTDSKTHVAHMQKGDFYDSEKSVTFPAAGTVRIEHVGANGDVKVLKKDFGIEAGEVIDSSFVNVKELRAYYEKEIASAKEQGVLLSLHLKATMMKISDPVMFGHAVTVFYKDVFAKHADTFATLGVNPANGLQDVYDKIATLPADKKAEIEADIKAVYATRPDLAMVNSAKGTTNLHVPNDIIVDASMPVVVRDSGKMWNKDDKLQDTKCLIPDRCYATMYQEVLSFCKANGQFDVSTMGNVANVGLMAQKAEEYGSHDKTFIQSEAGTMRVVDQSGKVVFENKVEEGDIWRMCQAKDAPIRDWVRLAVSRARATGAPAIFWLDAARAHDVQMINKVNLYLKDHDTTGLDITIMTPADAMKVSCQRAKDGKDTISVSGNVIRDYLTDLFPILELGTSAKMLSIVPLLEGGGLFETGAGGSAPKHVEQFVREGHLRWDSLGEYLALSVSLEHLGNSQNNQKALVLGSTLTKAIARLLDNNKSPSRKVNEIDNRGSSFYLGLYWAEFMAAEDADYTDLANKLKANRSAIVAELKGCQGKPVDLGGYFRLDEIKARNAMRPSATLNRILDE
jgi:isocitrate dehydrogenase